MVMKRKTMMLKGKNGEVTTGILISYKTQRLFSIFFLLVSPVLSFSPLLPQ
jgi:hypothetical protein